MAKLFEPPRYIAVEGPLGAGKSALAGLIAGRLHAQRVMEGENSSFLQAFPADGQGAGFQAQLAFLIQRFEQLRQLETGPDSKKTVVADYIFEKDKVFACLNLNDGELEIYDRYYNHFRRQLSRPDLVIYLRASPQVLIERRHKNRAPGEAAASDGYIEEVAKAYEHFFLHYTSSDLLVVNSDPMDFVERDSDLQELLRRMTEPIHGIQYFLPLGA